MVKRSIFSGTAERSVLCAMVERSGANPRTLSLLRCKSSGDLPVLPIPFQSKLRAARGRLCRALDRTEFYVEKLKEIIGFEIPN